MAAQLSEGELLVNELEIRVDRLRSLYDQYFCGIEKLEPHVARKDVDRRIVLLRKQNLKNTALRFRFLTIVQKFNTYQSYWGRICRQIEEGTYKRDVRRAQARFGPEADERNAARERARDRDKKPDVSTIELEAADFDEELDMNDLKLSLDDDFDSKDTNPPPPMPQGAGSGVGRPSFGPGSLDNPFGSMRPPGSGTGTGPVSIPPPVPSSRASQDRPPPQPRPFGNEPQTGLRAKVPAIVQRAAGPARPGTSTGPLTTTQVSPHDRAPAQAQAAPPAQTTQPRVPAPNPSLGGRPAVPPSSPGANLGAGLGSGLGATLGARPPPSSVARPAATSQAAPPHARPAAAAAAPQARPPVRSSGDLSEERERQLYSQYVDAKRSRQESTASITYDGFAKTLRDSSAKVKEKHGDKKVDFEVTVKDGKTILRPVVK